MKTQTDQDLYIYWCTIYASARDNSLALAAWREIEVIKNRHGGNVPPMESEAAENKILLKWNLP